ncbi:hypothetical protein G7Y89_g4107 [Cudoniella acicularis]|uniref:Uncharacterized protein n=1 Tax=Cudoniella acicularis TaxID=354080 RepID=A0A8H4RQ41_9HELO|nr:hypothetical protein G7Y89_g4107 [Cudoniella acicularis]
MSGHRDLDPNGIESLVGKMNVISVGEKSQHKIIIGIDYGTTFSGVSYVTTDKSDIDDINIISSWPGDSSASWKTPTRIAYSKNNPTIKSNKWGFEVYPKLTSYSWTKLLLDKNAAVGDHDDPALSNMVGPGMLQLPHFRDAAGVCEDFLHEVYTHVSGRLRQQMTDLTFENTPMECWITLPAIWSEEAKDATLKAAKNAGFGSRPDDNVFTIAEPEAAAIATLKRFADPNALNPVKVNDNILLCDCGGGTVDITTYTITQVQPCLSFDELCIGIGGKCGSTYIDRNLHALLSKRFGSAFDDLTFGQKGPGSKFMACFELLKRDFGLNEDREVRELSPLNLCLPDSEYYDDYDRTVKLTYEDMQSLFDPVVAEITGLVDQQVKEAKQEKNAMIDRIILVGGFGESPYLNKALADWCRRNGNMTLICPEHPQSAVVLGAALRGLEGIAPRVKRLRRHYGVAVASSFREGIDPESLAYFDTLENKKLCLNRMKWLIFKGHEVIKGTSKTTELQTEYTPGKRRVHRVILYSTALTDPPEYSTHSKIIVDVARATRRLPPELRAVTDPEVLATLDDLRKKYADLVELIARDLSSTKNRFILELIQNAEDCQFNRTNEIPSISFEVHPEKIVLETNEDGFIERDVRQMCSTRASWKRHQHGYVGEKGIGFKSVFQVASRVQIQSNSFSFSFEYDGDGRSEDKLGMVTPILGDEPIPLNERPLTRIILTPNDISYQELVADFEALHPSLLLFLPKMKEIKVTIHRPDRETTVAIFSKSEDPATNLTCLTKTSTNEENAEGTDIEILRYYVFKTPVSDLPDDEARPERNGCEVVLAFPVNDLDHPLNTTEHDIFAFLPVGRFLIQADFILQANREEIMIDSDWNTAILAHIVETFCDAVLEFCRRDSPLRYQWVKFLPARKALALHPFWRGLFSRVTELLNDKDILYLHESQELRPPGTLRILPADYLDMNGSPLFTDRPGREGKYLSLRYDPEDIETFKNVFSMRDLTDESICRRIRQDLNSPSSKIQSQDTTEDWHGRAAQLISSILARSLGTELETHIKWLPLIPMNDGRWVCAAENPVYFPSDSEPSIPRDIIVTIRPDAAANLSRKAMFAALGATACPLRIVIDKLFDIYLRQGGASDLAVSVEHLRYLYWNYHFATDRRFLLLSIYDNQERKVTSRQHVIYLPSEDEYGPQELFKPVQYPQRMTPSIPVPFVNRLGWLKEALGVRDVPRLRFDAGALSTEFRHILRFRPDKVIGTLKQHWSVYRAQLSLAIVDEISTANVTCWGISPTPLKSTYFPMPILKEEAQNLGIVEGFPFLKAPNLSEEDFFYEDWSFLERFQVKFHEGLPFYMEILSQHQSRRQKPWGDEIRNDILDTYISVACYCSENNRDSLVESFHREDLILDPCSFLPDSAAPTWIGIESCLWEGPADLLDKRTLASLPEYRNDAQITRLFHGVLGIQNAYWNDYIRTLSKLKRDPNTPVDISTRVLRLYRLLAEANINDASWDLIRDTFETQRLIYVPSTSEWFPPSQCLWSSPVPIDGKAIIGNDYPEELRGDFFLGRLRISPASLATLVEGLRILNGRHNSVANIKQTIRAINSMNPQQVDLASLSNCNILPTGGPGFGGSVQLRNCQDTFAIIDRVKLTGVFRDHVELLAFSLEEVCEFEPFLRALGLNRKFLSQLCTEQTACNEGGTVDEGLTAEFKDRAYHFLRCAVSNRSPLTAGAPQVLYDRLLTTSVLTTDSISIEYTLHYANGETTGPISQGAGYVHIREHGNTWNIFVPSNRRNKEVCYRKHLPEALASLFQVPISARETLSYVLNSSSWAIDDLLETAGIGNVLGIEPQVRIQAEEPGVLEVEQGLVTNFEELRAAPAASRQSPSSPINRVNSMILGLPSSPISGVSALQLLPERIPRQIVHHNVDAYVELLDHVIRIASRTDLPHSDFPAAPSNGQFLRGYDREAAFGIRSQNQMLHDSKIGAAGELFVFEILLGLLPEYFNRSSWRSTIMREVTVHPSYQDLGSWDQRETADIVYQDIGSRLTRLLIQRGYLEDYWGGAEPEYYIEVKTTTGNCSDRFFMSANQYRMLQEMTLTPGQTSESIYVIFRVFDLGKESMNVKIYVDPEAHRLRDGLMFESQTWTVTPRLTVISRVIRKLSRSPGADRGNVGNKSANSKKTDTSTVSPSYLYLLMSRLRKLVKIVKVTTKVSSAGCLRVTNQHAATYRATYQLTATPKATF